ncbi:hypothetical protein Hanom_Chr12g01176131 [Helianthus anomalus]
MQHEKVTAYVVDLQEELHDSQPTVEAIVFGCKLEALLGWYQMHYLDRLQGPPVYPCFERAKHVMASLDGTSE